MNRKRLLVVLVLCCMACSPVPAQQAEAPGPVGGAPAAVPDLRLPSVQELRAPLPRTARAATALAGLGRQRLALVLGLGSIGNQVVLAPAARDAQAVAAALSSGGFVVMRREDVSGDELRAALAEFRARLQPEGVGFVYVTALGAQLSGTNLLLPRDTPLASAPAEAAQARPLRAHGVPLAEVATALAGPPGSLRILVVDAAYRHAALAALPQPGLAEQPLPPGVMALFGHGLNVAREVPAAAPLPAPAPTDPAEIAATPFARLLAGVLTTPRISGPQALLSTRRALLDATQGRENPWLGGETDSDEELAEATLLDALVPRTPEEVAHQGLKQAGDRLRRQATSPAGERRVADVLAQPPVSRTGPGAPEGTAPDPAGTASPALPDPPAAGGLGTTVGNAANAAGAVAATVGGVAATGAAVSAVAAVVTASQAATVATVAGSAAGTAGAVAGQAAALMSRTVGGGGGGGGGGAAEVVAGEAARSRMAAQAAAQAGAPAAAPAVAPGAWAMAATAPATVAAATLAEPGPGASPAVGPRTPPRGGTSGPEGRTVRQAEGGERPAYVPRRNVFGYAEGDTFSYQVVDRWSDQVTGSYTHVIEGVLADGRLVANGQQLQLDAQGRIRSQRHADGGFSEFVPVQDLWWSQPKTGERREIGFTEIFQRTGQGQGETEWQGTSSVGTPRRIETPAGGFDVLPIESSGWYRQTLAGGRHSMGLWNRTVYYSTELGHPVAIDIQDANRMGKPLRRERVELTHAQTSRGAP